MTQSVVVGSSLWIYVSWWVLLTMTNGLRADAAIVTVVETMVGRTVALPCSAIQHPNQPAPNLLLFYKTSSNIPFFSYDARSGNFWRDGSPKIGDDKYEGRISLDLSEHRKASLKLKNVQLKDGGKVTCRVDFLGSPSLTSIIDLRVYAAPKQGPKITMKDAASPVRLITKSEVGPFYEGETLSLSCYVIGGYPTPKVSWWQDKVMIDNSSRLISGNAERVTNDVKIGPLTRKLAQSPLTCRAQNNPLTLPMEKTIYVKIHMAPESVLLPVSPTVSANIEEGLECKAIGAYPEANVSWSLDGRPLNFSAQETRQLGSDTLSRVRFVARPEDNGATITCTAASPTLQVKAVSTSSILNVTHAPIVWLRLGSNLKVNEIRQGADVYFDCEVKANPLLHSIAWYKNSENVLHNKENGVIVGGKNLVLQKVQRSDAGNYSCGATNSVGATRSRTLQLSVQYAPMCSQERQTLIAVEGDVLTLECRVDAYPSNVTFFWLFNNTVDSTRFRKSEYISEGATSKLKYVAYTAREYGTIYCWAQNVVATQSHPCSFTLQPAGAPDSVRDCVLTNQSAGSLHITCKPGSDGGLTQSFRAEIFTSKSSDNPVRVLEGMMPVFTVEGLAAGGDYVVRVTAINKKGASVAVSLEAFTLKVAENRMISGVSTSSNPEEILDPTDEEVSPLFGVVAGVILVMLALSTIAIFATKRRCIIRDRRTPDLVAGQELEPHTPVTSSVPELSQPLNHKSSLRNTHKLAHHQELVETAPFLQTGTVETEMSVEHLLDPDTVGGGTSIGGVFTIPTNIPPPPQYCAGSCNEVASNQLQQHPLCPGSPSCGKTYFATHDIYQYSQSPTGYQKSISATTSPTSCKPNHNPGIQQQILCRQTVQQCGTNCDQSPSGRVSSPNMCGSDRFACDQECTERMSSPVCYITPHPGVSAQYSSSDRLLEQTACSPVMNQSFCDQRHSMGTVSPTSGSSIRTQDTIIGHHSPTKGKKMPNWSQGLEESSFSYMNDEDPKEDCAL